MNSPNQPTDPQAPEALRVGVVSTPVPVVLPEGEAMPQAPISAALANRRPDVILLKSFIQGAQAAGVIAATEDPMHLICNYFGHDPAAYDAERQALSDYLRRVHNATHGDAAAPGQAVVFGASP